MTVPVPPDDLRVDDVVVMEDRFRITEVTADRIWVGGVSYSKVSQFPDIDRTWLLVPDGFPE